MAKKRNDLEKTTDRLNCCIGIGVGILAVAAAGASGPVVIAVGVAGAVIGRDARRIGKWWKNKYKKKGDYSNDEEEKEKE